MKSVPRWISNLIARSFARGHQENWLAMVELWKVRPGASLLDIGCGNGEVTVMVSQKVGAGEIIGIDVVPENLAALKSKGIVGIRADLEGGLPLKDESVDMVLASHVIEHVSDTDLFVSEIYRVLRRGGEVVVATPNLAALPNILFLMLGQQPPSTSVSDVACVGLWDRLWGGERCLRHALDTWEVTNIGVSLSEAPLRVYCGTMGF